MNRARGYILGSLLALCVVWLSQATAAGAADPQEVIEQTSSHLQQVLLDDRKRLIEDPDYVFRLADEVFLPHVDMERVSILVLGRHWRKANAAQKQAFAREFKRLLVRTYATALRELGEWEIEFLPLRMQPGAENAVVQSRVSRAGAPPVAMDYQMRRKDGKWLAYDVKIEGISLITNYRSSFSRLIRQKGIGGLIDELAARNDQKAPAKDDAVAANGRSR